MVEITAASTQWTSLVAHSFIRSALATFHVHDRAEQTREDGHVVACLYYVYILYTNRQLELGGIRNFKRNRSCGRHHNQPMRSGALIGPFVHIHDVNPHTLPL